MLIMVGLSVLIGALLGLRYNVFILGPTLMLALLGTAVLGSIDGTPMWSLFIAMVCVVIALQLSYLAGSSARVAVANVGLSKPNVEAKNIAYSDAQRATGNFKLLDIKEHMEVVGFDGEHVGTVDHKEGAQRIVLTGEDPKAGGELHLITIDWVDYVNGKVHLNKQSNKAVSEWLVAA
jgi:hypothetical protein